MISESGGEPTVVGAAGDDDGGAPAPQSEGALPVGTRLGEFEVVSLIGVGGFGIVYLALDHSLGRRVALKEYMPQTLAVRGAGSQVTVRSRRHADTFEAGRRSFVNEARLLAQFDHPSLVKVYRFWEANGTAYMVMPFYEGSTLKDALRARTSPPDEAWLKRLLAPLLDALDVLHGAHVYHRDIAPDNIMLLAGERPLLLDFGAARHVISDMTQAPTVILKSGYAPIEQYAEMAQMKQGAWTDVYALAAVVYYCIVGRTPQPAVSRMVSDTQPLLLHLAAGRYSEAFLRAIDAALTVRPEQRPQSMGEFRLLLGLSPVAADAGPAATGVERAGPAAARLAGLPRPVAAGLALAALAGAVAVGVSVWRGAGPSEPEAVATTAEQPSPTAAASTPAPPEPRPERPFDPLAELDRVFEQRNRAHNVGVALAQSQVEIGRGRLSFALRTTQPGYLYIVMAGTDQRHLYLLFPNQVDPNNRVAAGERIELPRKGWLMVAEGPPGINQFVAFVSENPRDFSQAGLVPVGPFAEFPLEAVARAARSGASPLVGKVVCPHGGSDCSASYGAAAFTIEEVPPARR